MRAQNNAPRINRYRNINMSAPSHYRAYALTMEDLKQLALNIFTQALADCSIPRAFDRKLLHPHRRPQALSFSSTAKKSLALDRLKRIRIVAAGKAAAPMLDALLARLTLPPSSDLAGVLIAPQRPQNLPASIDFFPGGHPSPNQASFAGASAALSMMQAAANDPPQTTRSASSSSVAALPP